VVGIGVDSQGDRVARRDLHDFAIREPGARDLAAGAAAEHDDGLSGRNQFALFGQFAQHRAVGRRDDRRQSEIEGCGIACGARDARLRAQILQLLEADDFIGAQSLATLEIAFGFGGDFFGLRVLRGDFGQIELREQLTLAHRLSFAHDDALQNAAGLERQAHLVVARDQTVCGDHGRSRPGERGCRAHGGAVGGFAVALGFAAGGEHGERGDGENACGSMHG